MGKALANKDADAAEEQEFDKQKITELKKENEDLKTAKALMVDQIETAEKEALAKDKEIEDLKAEKTALETSLTEQKADSETTVQERESEFQKRIDEMKKDVQMCQDAIKSQGSSKD